MGERETKKRTKGMQIANLGNINGTIGVIFWRWRTEYGAELPYIVKNQSKPERFFI